MTTQDKIWTAGGTFHLPEHVGLGHGEKLGNSSMRTFDVKDDKPTMIVTWDIEVERGAQADAAYPITVDGEDTGYWIRPTIGVNGVFPSLAWGDCAVFSEKPSAWDPKPDVYAPFSCYSWKHWGANDFTFYVQNRG